MSEEGRLTLEETILVFAQPRINGESYHKGKKSSDKMPIQVQPSVRLSAFVTLAKVVF